MCEYDPDVRRALPVQHSSFCYSINIFLALVSSFFNRKYIESTFFNEVDNKFMALIYFFNGNTN